jgi:hypothetical protein
MINPGETMNSVVMMGAAALGAALVSSPALAVASIEKIATVQGSWTSAPFTFGGNGFGGGGSLRTPFTQGDLTAADFSSFALSGGGSFGGIAFSSLTSAAVTLYQGAFIAYDITAAVTINGKASTINLSKANGTTITIGDDTYSGAFGFTNVTLGQAAAAAAAVPEPASWAMMIGGFGLVGAAMRRQRKVAVRFA